MPVTPFYAAVFAFVFVVLSVRTLRMRRELKIPVGDGGNQKLLRALRVHGNFAEYAPFALLLIFMLESVGARQSFIHFLCVCLLLGRLAHAYGVSQAAENYRYRVFGMAMTFISLVGSAIGLLVKYA